MRRTIKLRESELKKMIAESVKRALNENYSASECASEASEIIEDMVDDEYGYSYEELNSMSPYEVIDSWLQWEGIQGYTDKILTLVSGLYNVDLNG